MMAVIFFILLLAVLLAWIGRRQISIYIFILSMGLSIIWFLHHITSHLALQL
jgi:hypothetical protein